MFFYNEKLQLHINDEPLLISAKVQNAATKVGIQLTWDNQGRVHQVSYDETKLLCEGLGIVMLSVRDFMSIAKEDPRMASPAFAEWLKDTYSLSESGAMITSCGETLNVPPSRPDWFHIENIGEDGLPTKLSSTAGSGRWKFWTQNDSSFTAAAARSYVTSSGTCSLDLGIPSFAKHPNFMIRECYKSRPPPLNNPLDEIWKIYEEKTLSRNDKEIWDFFKSLDLDALSQPQEEMDEFTVEKNRERLVDLDGKKRLIEGNFSGLQTIDLQTMTKALATTPDEDTVYVIGHSHPDADAIVGAVFEAVRRSLFYDKKCVCWAQRVPNVVKHILGPQISDILTNVPKFGPIHDIVLVDCHETDQGENYQIKAIIDHHIITRKFPYYIAISQEVSWSSTVQIYIKFLGSGFDLDYITAKLLLEATVIEAEPSLTALFSNA